METNDGARIEAITARRGSSHEHSIGKRRQRHMARFKSRGKTKRNRKEAHAHDRHRTGRKGRQTGWTPV